MSSRVLFVAGDRRHRDVYVADLDGYGPRKLTDQKQIIVSPSVSPDGKYLSFTSYKEGTPNLYVVDLATNREVYVDRQEGMKVGSSWRDGKTLAYAHTLGKFSTIYAVNVETKAADLPAPERGDPQLPDVQSRRQQNALCLRHVWRAEYFYEGHGVGRDKASLLFWQL